jgi:hypothetical protein
MGNNPVKYIGFDELSCLGDRDLLITVMGYNTNAFIARTILPNQEETVINGIINAKTQKEYTVYIYGKNCKDIDVIGKRIHQLKELGFNKFAVYASGFFEYLLLRETFGESRFPIIGQIKSAGVIEFS